MEGIEHEHQDVKDQLEGESKIVEEEDDGSMDRAWDDATGAEFNFSMVKIARQEEAEYIRKMKLYTKVPISECWGKIGKKPTYVRWIDVKKGDVEASNHRPRLVAKEIMAYKRVDLFAATPPFEALKLILSMCATSNLGEVVMVNDVSRAFSTLKLREMCTSIYHMKINNLVRRLNVQSLSTPFVEPGTRPLIGTMIAPNN